MSYNRLSKSNRPRFECDQSVSGRFPKNIRNDSSEYSIAVKHIPANVTRDAIIDFASQFGILQIEPHITQSTEKLQKMAWLTFTERSAVHRCMNGPRESYTIGGHAVTVQRWLPIGLTFERSYRILLFIEGNDSNIELTENDIRTYFHTHYGQTKSFTWTSEAVATIDFDDYDSIDRATLTSVIHTINGVDVRIEKVRSAIVRSAYAQTIAPHDIKYCVHVRNIPSHVSGEELAQMFNSRIWDVLIRKGVRPDTDPFEAWIMNIGTMSDAEQLAASIQSINETSIECTAETELINEWTLCSGNRNGWCKHGENCIYRHVMCKSGDGCTNEECPYSHSKRRNIVPSPRYRPAGPIDQHYRIKIDGLPLEMTSMELLSELKKQPLNLLELIETPEIPKDAKTRHFYLVRQASEKLARKRIYEWHNYPIRTNHTVKCQLEYDRISKTSSSSNSASQTDNQQRLRILFAPLSPGDKEICGMPSEWIWTNRCLRKTTNNVYLVYPSDSMDDRLGAMKVYRDPKTFETMRAKIELRALRLLANEQGVVSVYQNNIFDVIREQDAPLWIITELISELTLEDFIEKYKSDITFHSSLLLTRQILEIVQRCHHAHVFHRNIKPNNIIVRCNDNYISADEIKLVLIDFGLAWINNHELSITNEDELKMLEHVIQKYSNDDLKQSSESSFCTLKHLLSSSSIRQSCSSKIDPTDVCRIFFWLLTDKWPDQASYTTYPHNENEYQQKINEKLEDAQNNTQLYKELMNIFDRTFGSSDNWWSINELIDALDTIHVLFVEYETSLFNNLFPITTDTELLPLNDLYARTIGLIARAKQQFAQKYSTCVKWSDGCNQWSCKNKGVELRNTDELIYDRQEQHCTVPVICSTKIECDVGILLIGSNTKDGTIQLKPLCSINNETNDVVFSKYFDDVLKKIIREKLKQTLSSP